MERRVEIFDSTLRDGSQGEGLSFSVEDKRLLILDTTEPTTCAFIVRAMSSHSPRERRACLACASRAIIPPKT